MVILFSSSTILSLLLDGISISKSSLKEIFNALAIF
jgi:hypothetical protein